MMSPEESFFLAAVILVGVMQACRAMRNATAIALVMTWAACRLIYELAGQCPVQAMFLSDMVVIASMFVKEDWFECPYRNGWHQLACMWIERSPWDKAILCLFPLAWLLYFPATSAFIGPAARLLIRSVTDGQIQFWTLYGIGLAQLALAGWEGLHNWQRTRGHVSHVDAPDDGSGSLFAPVRGEAYA